MEKTIKIDDIDGTDSDVQPVTFTVGKTNYVIDLGPENRAQLADALAPFIEHARRTTSTPKRARTTTRARRRNAAAERVRDNEETIRQWAADNATNNDEPRD